MLRRNTRAVVCMPIVAFAALSGEALGDEPAASEPAASEPAAAEPAVSEGLGPVSSEWRVGVPSAVTLGLVGGFDGRLDDPGFGERTDHGGFVFGGGADLWLARRVSLGLRYEHRDLGGEDTGIRETGTARTQRESNTLWLPLRLYPLRTEHIGVYLGLGLGAVWQHVDASGSVWSAATPHRSVSFVCQGNDALSFGLRAQAGVALPLGSNWSAELGARFDNLALDDALLEGCAPGVGSVQSVGVVAQLGYTFDWSDP